MVYPAVVVSVAVLVVAVIMVFVIPVFANVFTAMGATLPLPTVVVVTTSLLVAARNFEGEWLMRTLGEHNYRHWMSAQLGSVAAGC